MTAVSQGVAHIPAERLVRCFGPLDRSRALAPERALAMAVLAQALVDLEQSRGSFFRRNKIVYHEAHKWLASDDRSWPFSFLNLCDALQLSPGAIRARWLKLGNVQEGSCRWERDEHRCHAS